MKRLDTVLRSDLTEGVGVGGVFINYRTADNPVAAAAIWQDLRDRLGPGQVFRDCQTLEPGQQYPTEIRNALAAADVVVAVIGPRWLSLTDPHTGQRLIDREHDWVRREITLAFELGIPVVPVLLKDTPENACRLQPDQLPECLRRLATTQVAEVSQRRLDKDLDALATALAAWVPALKNQTAHEAAAQQNRVTSAAEPARAVVTQRARASGRGRIYQAGRDLTVGE